MEIQNICMRDWLRCFLVSLSFACSHMHADAFAQTSTSSGQSIHQAFLDATFGTTAKSKAEKPDPQLEALRDQLNSPKAEWIQDPQNGCRILNRNPEKDESIKYTGVCRNGLANGYGKIEWYKKDKPNGVTIGHWLGGLPEGHVVHVGDDVSFEGQYAHGRMNGSGTTTLKDGSIYKGEFKDGLRSGYGVLIRADKQKFEGEFFKNQFMGYAPPLGADLNTSISNKFEDLVKAKFLQALEIYKEGFHRVGFEILIILSMVGLFVGGLLSNFINRSSIIESIKSKGEEPGFGFFKPYSYCPSCRQSLGWKNIIPIVSYALQKGHCHKCQAKIGFRYLLIEVAASFIFIISALTWSKFGELFIYLFALLALMCCAFIGFRYLNVSKRLTVLIAVLGLLASALKITSITAEDAILGGAMGYLFPWLYNIIYSKQHAKNNLIDDSNFLLMAGIGVWVGPVVATITLSFGFLVQGFISTIRASKEYKVHEYQKPIVCVIAIFTLLLRY